MGNPEYFVQQSLNSNIQQNQQQYAQQNASIQPLSMPDMIPRGIPSMPSIPKDMNLEMEQTKQEPDFDYLAKRFDSLRKR